MPIISTVRLPSASLQKTITYSALIPEVHGVGLGPYPVLYLFHPTGGDHADWIVKTRLERWVRRSPLIVILPSLGYSLGCDTASGEEYQRFFAEELMPHVESAYAVRSGSENTVIAGAGSGGYAALRLALAFPYWFGAAVSLSGEVFAPHENRIRELPDGLETARRYRRVFGPPDDPRRKTFDLLSMAEALPHDEHPAFLIDCGQEDARLAHNREFHRRLTALKIRHEYNEPPGGHHWGYWDERLQNSINFLSGVLGI